MRRYELMVILDPDLEERTIAPSLDQFLGVVQAGRRQRWRRSTSGAAAGSRTRSTRSPKASTPWSTCQAEPATVKELDRQLNLNEAVLRTKVHASRRQTDHA